LLLLLLLLLLPAAAAAAAAARNGVAREGICAKLAPHSLPQAISVFCPGCCALEEPRV